MKKWIKIILVLSLLLNVCLGIAVFAGRGYFRQTTFQMVTKNAEAQMQLNQHLLNELESGDLKRIEALKPFLRDSVENCKKAAEAFRTALEK